MTIKSLLTLGAWLLCCAGVHAEVINIDSSQLARLAASGVPIIDIRTEGEWKSTGVVPGSKLLTFFDESRRSDPPAWLAKLKTHAQANQPVILICRSGSRSLAAARFLSEQAGYATVYNASKGIIGWASEGRPVTPVSLPASPQTTSK